MNEVEAIAAATADFQRLLKGEMEASQWNTPERMRVMEEVLSLLCRIRDGDEKESLASHRRICELISDLLDGKIPRGRKTHGERGRDLQICIAIHRAVECGFVATRNEATDGGVSACSIVAKALANVGLHLSEKRIANIWSENAWRR